jgi:hypothetical protein
MSRWQQRADTERMWSFRDFWGDVTVPTDTIRRPSSATGDTLLAVGWMAVLTPVVYMAVVGWNSGEQGGTVSLFGVLATLFQLLVWGSAWMNGTMAERSRPRDPLVTRSPAVVAADR